MAITLQLSLDILMTLQFMIFSFSLRCYTATPKNTCKVEQVLTCVLPTFANHPKSLGEEKKSYVSNKPINKEQTDCSLSELKWAARCVLSRQLNFRQLNILGNVWKLNCEGEQRRVARIKRCGVTQKALSYRGAHSPAVASVCAQILTQGPHTHTHTGATCQSVLIGVSIS